MPDPIAFSLFGLEVRWYGILISSAILIGILIATHRGKKQGIISDDILDIVLVSIPAAMIGARLYYVAFKLDYYLANPKEIFMIWEGGLAIHGGLIGAFLTGYVVCRVKKLKFTKVLDVFAPAFPLGQSIGRWGNYFNQEAYGAETDLPWAITVMDPVKGLIQVHPTFLYESIWNLLVLGIVLFYEKTKKKFDGELILIYGIYYSAGRFFIEGLRTDSLMFMNMRVAQLISFAVIMICTLYLKKIRSQSPIK
ncbi:prolipoprotein diacylglyceryl transferase [Alkalibacter saccharofermentans]|uniref:Phosphatidylglycerol--prolipoprotein diacylglyceryl transferase n=1 Tax=Alkalibacter saccharofermentans DSM 14828 TaxID=1120975 RepID=A0A1M4UGH6_9FIRM|nr:prolipoprotein diacylglyceryl transferase [Alkalibacter saccharofermentans]SHE55764.1 Prolipoprotein diacylglyceryl transferase [Alkalibacter saccharofermentans DSM 14828]